MIRGTHAKRRIKKIDLYLFRKRTGRYCNKNAKIVDVYSGEIIEGEDIAIVDGKIAGIGHYEGKEVVDAQEVMRCPDLLTDIFILSHLM